MTQTLNRSLDRRVVIFNKENTLVCSSKMPEYKEFFQVLLDSKDVTEKYYRFLQANKLTQKRWRYSKSKNHFSIGYNSDRAIFNVEDELLISFINSVK